MSAERELISMDRYRADALTNAETIGMLYQNSEGLISHSLGDNFLLTKT